MIISIFFTLLSCASGTYIYMNRKYYLMQLSFLVVWFYKYYNILKKYYNHKLLSLTDKTMQIWVNDTEYSLDIDIKTDDIVTIRYYKNDKFYRLIVKAKENFILTFLLNKIFSCSFENNRDYILWGALKNSETGTEIPLTEYLNEYYHSVYDEMVENSNDMWERITKDTTEWHTYFIKDGKHLLNENDSIHFLDYLGDEMILNF